MVERNWIKRHPVWTGIIGVVVLFVLIGFFSGGDDNRSTSNTKSTSDTKNTIEKMTALEQMEIAFVGSYSYSEIKNRIDTVMQLYGLSMTNENYSRFGSALVGVRKETGTPEMDILTCMNSLDYRNTIGWDKVTAEKAVPDAVGICGATLSS